MPDSEPTMSRILSALFDGSDFEAIGAAIETMQRAFAAARTGRGGGPKGNGLVVAETELLVDQVRGVANTPGHPENWMERDGLQLMRNDTLMSRSFLGYVVGDARYLSSQDVVMILANLVRPLPIREPDVANFVNLFAAEPPEHELAIWLTVATLIAAGKVQAYIHLRIPELVSDHDVLHAEIPTGAQLSANLLPGAVKPLEPTMMRYQERIFATALPDVVAPMRAELEAYVRTHLHAELAAETARTAHIFKP